MRKIIFFNVFLLLFVLGACSTDGDILPPNDNHLIGAWVLQTYLYNGVEYIPEECEAQVNVEFLSTGIATYTKFYEIMGEEECVAYTYNEEWEYMGDEIYKFTEEDNKSYIVQITFSDNNRVYTVTSEDEDGSYRAVYKKV